MTSLLNLTQTPNLLELVEAYRSDLTVKPGRAISTADRTGSRLGHLSICDDDVTGADLSACSDDVNRADLSVCGDEFPDLATSVFDLSPCADDRTQLRLADSSVCGDEEPAGDQSVCADEPTG